MEEKNLPENVNKPLSFEIWADEIYRDSLHPESSSKFVPNWYKQRPRYQISNDIKDLRVINDAGTDAAQLSFKHCPPFLDAITAGYMYQLPIDIHVKIGENGAPEISWDHEILRPVEIRGYLEIPVPHGHHPVHFMWDTRWAAKLPEGYSVLYTHPMNRSDLPFVTSSGIIDSDKWYSQNSYSFFLREGFEGVIPAGTPIIQMFPFKRDDWKLEINNSLKSSGSWDLQRKKIYIAGYYKKFRWTRKNYD